MLDTMDTFGLKPLAMTWQVSLNLQRRFFDQSVGMRLRNEVYKTGNTRDVQKSVETFLGRKQSLDAFLKTSEFSKEVH